MIEKNYKAIIIAILLFIATLSVLNAKNDSAIFDETAHIPAGYSYVKYRDMRLNPEHPPLIKDLSGLPLLPMDLNFNTEKDFWTKDVNGQWDAGRNLLWEEGNDADRIIFWSRLPIVLLSIILGFFIFKWARELAGISAGLLALALYAFDPNILGHNHFVTTDLGIAAFATFSFYYFLKFIKEPSWKNVLIGGFFLGLVQLAKFSSIMLFPIFGLVLIIYPLVRKRRNADENPLLFRLKKISEYLGKGALAFMVSLALVWGVYFANVYEMPKEKLAETIRYYFSAESENIAEVYTAKALLALNENDAGRPLSEYILGIAMVFKRVSGGNSAYFAGEVSNIAFPDYFPTVFLLKEPLAILFLALLALFIAFSKNISAFFHGLAKKEKVRTFSELIRHNITSLSLFAFIILYSYISVTGNLNIGFRHLFPILPFIYILVAKVIFDFIKRLHKNGQIVWKFTIAALALFLAVETAAAYPAYMSYFNPIAGGSKNGYRYVADSNADWGQDLKRLRDWINDYNYCAGMKCDPDLRFGCPDLCSEISKDSAELGRIEKIRVDYFGGGDPYYYLKDKYIRWWDSRRPIDPGWYAISANYLMLSIHDRSKSDNESHRWLKDKKPVYQVGTSVFVYNITPEQSAAAE